VKAFGCPVYQHKESGAHYPISALTDQQTFAWGEATLQFLATPGHTPDGMSALIFDKASKTKPCAILTGDTLFVGSIGRPDLMGGAMAASTLAGMSYDTWQNKLAKLDDSVIVLPAHGAGSLCGAHLRDEPSSTIGTERATNPYLQHTGRNDFSPGWTSRGASIFQTQCPHESGRSPAGGLERAIAPGTGAGQDADRHQHLICG
jgi:glyoxylase-like metal-dependent hydrolase (beta-lactamase superfamily II)